MMTINTHCPWSGKKVTQDSITQYKGHAVGFCNTGCKDKFVKATTLFDQCLTDNNYGLTASYCRYADYNQWVNKKLYQVISQLTEEQYNQDLGAFFGSINATLNHILIWDINWLQRFSNHSTHFQSLEYILSFDKSSLNKTIVYEKLADLSLVRTKVDQTFMAFCHEINQADCDSVLTYRSQSGKKFNKSFAGLIQHVFNHQTHHRGQITTLLSQMGVDPGVTDLLATLEN